MGYVTVSQMRELGVCVGDATDARIQAALDAASALVDTVCGWWFEPRELTMSLDGTGREVIPVPVPICRIDEISVTWSDGVQSLLTAPEIDDVVVYNRHLSGLTAVLEDDRQAPRVAIRRILSTARGIAVWPRGRQNVTFSGWFGYTDPDPGNPLGVTPVLIRQAVTLLAEREIAALSEDVVDRREVTDPRSVVAHKTVDQEIRFASGAGTSSSASALGVITGDVVVDRILVQFMRPLDIRWV